MKKTFLPSLVLTFSMCLLQSLLSFRSSDQEELSARDSISLSQKDLVGESMRLRMKCQDQEEKLARQEVELKCVKINTLAKGSNLAQ